MAITKILICVGVDTDVVSQLPESPRGASKYQNKFQEVLARTAIKIFYSPDKDFMVPHFSANFIFKF